MASIVDDRGYNQGFVPTKALEVRTKRRIQAILSEMDFSVRRTIVEFGCGTGEASYLMATMTTADVIGVDLCVPFIEAAQQRFQSPNLKYIAINLLKDDSTLLFSGKVDYIVGNGILHHLRADLPMVLARMKHLLAPGGRIVFWEPNLFNPYVFLIFKFGFLRRRARLEPFEMAFRRRELYRYVCDAGFENVKVVYKDFLLPNTPTALISLFIWAGSILETIPLLNALAQSVFLSAEIQKRNDPSVS